MSTFGADLMKALYNFTSTYKQLNQAALDITGMDVQWMRAIPHENSEDVIFQEYTLHDVACPESVKVVLANTQYNPGNFTVDYFGINYEAPLEISVDIESWKSVFGEGIMPQQHDIVYSELWNGLYEVATSTIDYGFAAQETAYKVQLTKWNPRANVRLNQAVEETIDNLTVSEAELFGDEIANQVADIIDEPEISQMVNTPEGDGFKTRDLESITIGDVSTRDNIVAKSFYDMRYVTQSIIYNNGDYVDESETNSSRYFSCWFKLLGDSETASIGKLSQSNGKYYIDGNVSILEDSDDVDIDRGAFVHLHAVTNKVALSNGKLRYMLTFNNSEFREVTKNVTNWNNNLTLTKSVNHPLLMGRTNGKCNFNITIIGNSTLMLKFGSKIKRISLKKQIPCDIWSCIAVNLGEVSNIRIYGKDSAWNLKIIDEINLGDLANTFAVDEFYVPQSKTQLTHIRLYKTGEEVDEKTIMKDLSWVLTKNDSRTVINDNAAVPNQSPYITKQK